MLYDCFIFANSRQPIKAEQNFRIRFLKVKRKHIFAMLLNNRKYYFNLGLFYQKYENLEIVPLRT